MLQELDDLGLLVTAARPKPRELQWEDLSRLPFLSCAIKWVSTSHGIHQATWLIVAMSSCHPYYCS